MAAAKKKRSAVETSSPARNFTLTVEERIRSLVGGPPAFVRRKRQIEDLEAALVARLVALEEEIAEEHEGDDGAACDAFARAASRIDLRPINELIAKHNRFYPTEANLPMDPRTGLLIERGRPWAPLELVTIEALLEKARRA